MPHTEKKSSSIINAKKKIFRGIILKTFENFATASSNLKLNVQNDKWQIRHGGCQIENSINFYDTSNSGIFGVANYESEIRFLKCRMADPTW